MNIYIYGYINTKHFVEEKMFSILMYKRLRRRFDISKKKHYEKKRKSRPVPCFTLNVV